MLPAGNADASRARADPMANRNAVLAQTVAGSGVDHVGDAFGGFAVAETAGRHFHHQRRSGFVAFVIGAGSRCDR